MNKLINLIWMPEDTELSEVFDGSAMRGLMPPHIATCPMPGDINNGC